MATDDQEDDTSILPNDVVQDILLRLPVKSLLKFRTVSKSWNVMITNTQFIQMHHLQQYSNMNDNNNNNLFLHISANPSNNYKADLFSFVTLKAPKFRVESKLKCPFGFETVLCTCQGVILLSDTSCITYMLWNPSARKHATFWFPYWLDGFPQKHRLCYDPKTNDFKVVIATEEYYAVYSCKDESWTEIKNFGYTTCHMDSNMGISIDGVIYWVVFNERIKCREIIYFDPRDDGLKMLDMPENMKELFRDEFYYLVCLRGCLCLHYRVTSSSDEKTLFRRWRNVNEKNAAFRMWIKEKGRDNNCWSELMIVENFEKPPQAWFSPKCLFENNKILIHLDCTLQEKCEIARKLFSIFCRYRDVTNLFVRSYIIFLAIRASQTSLQGILKLVFLAILRISCSGRKFVIYCPFEKTFEEIEDVDPLLGIKLVPCPESLLFPLENLRPKRKRSKVREYDEFGMYEE